MIKTLGFLIAVVLVTGCTSTKGADPALANKYADCKQLSWSWCAAEDNR